MARDAPSRGRGALAVMGDALRRPELRRVELAYGAFVAAEYAVWLALLVYAYRHGGARAAALIAVVQVALSASLSPVIGALGDRFRPARVLVIGYVAQVVTMGAVAAAIALGAPVWVVFVLAPTTSVALSVPRPVQAALLPGVVGTPNELTASNVVIGWAEGVSGISGPVLAGLLLAVGGPAAATAGSAALAVVAVVLVLPVRGPEAAPDPDDLGEQLRATVAAAGRDPTLRVLMVLLAFSFLVVGALDLICVILAVDVVHLGAGAAGYLNGAVGLGVLMAGPATTLLVGRRHLARFLAIGLVGGAVALAVLAAAPSAAAAFILLAVTGFGTSVFDVTARTLLQRAAPADQLAGVFGLLEALMDVGLGLGSLLVPVAVAVGGFRAALVAPGVASLVLVALTWRRLRSVDDDAGVPQVQIRLLRSIAIFSPLPAPALEGLARRLRARRAVAGEVVVREGDVGHEYYAVADGTVAISRHGRPLATLGRGEGFGEIALLEDVPRTATATADTDALFYSLDKEPFVLVLTGHPAAAGVARDTVTRHRASHDPVTRHRASHDPAARDRARGDGSDPGPGDRPPGG